MMVMCSRVRLRCSTERGGPVVDFGGGTSTRHSGGAGRACQALSTA